jgi:hypothetical protein
VRITALDWSIRQTQISLDFWERLNVEKEHDGKMGRDVDVVGSKADLLKIVIAHLREDPQYYTKLKNMERGE